MLTRHLYAIAATGMSQQLQKLNLQDSELVEQLLRASSKEGAIKQTYSRETVRDILVNETLPFVEFEYQLERLRVEELERQDRAERDKDRRKTDIPIGLPLTRAAIESMVTALPRGTVVLIDGDAKAVKATIYAICNNLLKASSQPKTLFLRCRDTLQGSDFDVNKRADHRLALVPVSNWRKSLSSGSGWREFVSAQTTRLRDATCDCVVIEDATIHANKDMTYPDKLMRMDTIAPMLLRQARDTDSVVIAGVPGTKTGEGSGCYSDTESARIEHSNVTLATVRSNDDGEFAPLRLQMQASEALLRKDLKEFDWAPTIEEFDRGWFEDPQLIL